MNALRPDLGAAWARFREPPWQESLDVPRTLAHISRESTIAGMFFLATVDAAKRRGVTLSGTRERYLPFGFYPVAEFAPLLVAAAGVLHPGLSLRHALRAI